MPKNGPARVPRKAWFLDSNISKPKKGNISAHSSNISARAPQKSFLCTIEKDLAKSAMYNIILLSLP